VQRCTFAVAGSRAPTKSELHAAFRENGKVGCATRRISYQQSAAVAQFRPSGPDRSLLFRMLEHVRDSVARGACVTWGQAGPECIARPVDPPRPEGAARGLPGQLLSGVLGSCQHGIDSPDRHSTYRAVSRTFSLSTRLRRT
jgi:hypothetical protein